ARAARHSPSTVSVRRRRVPTSCAPSASRPRTSPSARSACCPGEENGMRRAQMRDKTRQKAAVAPPSSPLVELQKLGQSPWHDNIHRALLVSGRLARMIADGDVTGLTSNPTIFEQAIASSADYDEELRALAAKRKTAEQIFEALAVRDVREAADLFLPVFKRTAGRGGFVSLAVCGAASGDHMIAENLRAGAAESTPLLQPLTGEAANANAKLAYPASRRTFGSERFTTPARSGARVHRPLCASTSTKDPAYPD